MLAVPRGFSENAHSRHRDSEGDLEPCADLPVSCLPSYPYSEDSSQGKQYMNTRCPAWCDRVLMSPSAKELILRVSGGRALAHPVTGPQSLGAGARPVGPVGRAGRLGPARSETGKFSDFLEPLDLPAFFNPHILTQKECFPKNQHLNWFCQPH